MNISKFERTFRLRTVPFESDSITTLNIANNTNERLVGAGKIV